MESIPNLHKIENENNFEYYKFEDISQETLNMYLRRIRSKYNLGDENLGLKKLFEQEGLILGGGLSKSAIILFGGESADKYLTTIIKMKDNEVSLSKNIYGNLFVQIENIMGVLQETLDFIDPEDIFSDMEYPIKAVREAVINMLIHADYQNYKNNFIVIDDNSIVFKNNVPSNKFPNGKVDENLIYNGNLEDTNKKIKEIIKKSGINFYQSRSAFKMKKELEHKGMKKPSFYIDNGFFSVKFYKKDFFYISEFK